MSSFPGKGIVAALKTTPETILDDYQRVMKLAGFTEALPKSNRTGLKINISWQTWYPACSSAPWQVEGVILGLKNAGYDDLVGIHNDTVVVNTSDGEKNNKHSYITTKHNIPCLYLYNQEFEWIEYTPKRPFLVLDKVYPQGVFIPKALQGSILSICPPSKPMSLPPYRCHKNASADYDTAIDIGHTPISTIPGRLVDDPTRHPSLVVRYRTVPRRRWTLSTAMRWHEKTSSPPIRLLAMMRLSQSRFDPMTIYSAAHDKLGI
jgi:hypothetical protein